MKLLDLFCGAGGASKGYAMAGFEVTGVDLIDQPEYPYKFIKGNALDLLDNQDFIAEFDVIHASPPCKAFTLTGWAKRYGYNQNHEDLLTPTRIGLISSGKRWIIENVPNSPMRADLILCGSMFGLKLRRHRLFESNVPLSLKGLKHDHSYRVYSPHGNPHFKGEAKLWAEALDIDWMKSRELSQAIPPAYTHFIGEQLCDTPL